MKIQFAAAVALALAPAIAAAQSSTPGAQRTRAPQGQHASVKPPKGEITLVGCLERESTYRETEHLSKGGPLHSGIGQSDEFVLANARPLPAGRSAVGTSGTSRPGRAFMLGGKIEKNLTDAVGRQVEIVGTLDRTGSEKPGELPKVNISVWHEVADFCPTARR